MSGLHADQVGRWATGDKVLVEEYLVRYPGLQGAPEAVLDLIEQEVVLRERAGEVPHPDEYTARFPNLEKERL